MSTDQTIGLARQMAAAGKFAEAEQLCRQVLAGAPGEGRAVDLLGRLLMELGAVEASRGQIDAAESRFLEAARLLPHEPAAWQNLGALRLAQRRPAEALEPLDRAIRLKPDFVDAMQNLGLAYQELQRRDDAIAMYERALKLTGDAQARAWLMQMLGGLRQVYGQSEEAIECYRGSLVADASRNISFSSMLYAMHLQAGNTNEQIAAEHREFARRFEQPILRPRPPRPRGAPHGRIRVGLVSQDLRRHPVASFLPAALALDRARFEVTCYASVADPDDVTASLRRISERWVDIAHLSDAQASECIEQDQIDVLIDLSGHTPGNRLLIFPLRPAPLQLTWLGYPNTTGLTSIGYRITDTLADPPGTTEQLHSEKLLRLDPCFLCYEPPDAPPVSDPPCLTNGFVTFGSFNHFSKIGPQTIELWAQTLQAVQGSRLFVKNAELGGEYGRARLVSSFEAQGIPPARLLLQGRDASHHAHLDRYREVDIALDTFPYHGTTTTCEALWMGVATVTLAGRTHLSRVGVSLLTSAGHPEWIADTPARFVSLAASLSADVSRLRDIRRGLRDQMLGGPLCDAGAFARRLGDHLTAILAHQAGGAALP